MKKFEIKKGDTIIVEKVGSKRKGKVIDINKDMTRIIYEYKNWQGNKESGFLNSQENIKEVI